MIRALARLSVGNPVAVNLGMLAVALAGVATYATMPREVFPDFSLGSVVVTTLYPGASPEDVERLVTLPLEDELESLDGLDEMSSTSREGVSTIALKLRAGADARTFLDDVRTAVDRDHGFPAEVEEPEIREVKSEFPAIAVLVYGTASEPELREYAEDLKRRLERVAGVSSVQLTGTREPRIWVEVDPAALERHGLTLEQVGAAVGARSRDLPLGSLSTGGGEVLLRVESGVVRAADLDLLPVLVRPEGGVVRLRDVASAVDSFERPLTLARFNGHPSLHLQVNKDADGDMIRIAGEVRRQLVAEQGQTPPGIAVGANTDLSVYVRNRLNTMRESAAIGGVLVLISLVLFLSRKVALITALGIPISFLGGLLLAGLFGITMNMMTMFALIVVLGMIVDDAIVIGENAFRLMEEGHPPAEAAVRGTAEVGKPVTATILTTMAAFLPILLVPGTMGKFMRPLPLIVTFCLLASLLEALVVMPAHLAHWTGRREGRGSRSSPGPEDGGGANAAGQPDGDGARAAEHARRSRRAWYDPLREAYAVTLAAVVRWRYVSVALALAVTAVLGTVAQVALPFHLFDEFESKMFQVNLRAQPGSSLEETERVAIWAEGVVLELPEAEVESANTLVGIQAQDSSRWEFGESLAQVWVELREHEGRERSTAEILDDLRARLSRGQPPGLESLELQQPQAGPTGRAVDVSVRGPDLDVLREITGEMQAYLATVPGVRDLRDNARVGKREVRVVLRDEGRTLGFTEELLARELRTAFEGTRYARVRRGRDDVEVVVKLPEELRRDARALQDLRVSLPAAVPNGISAATPRVPLASVAELIETVGPEVISRDDGERSIRVFADVDKDVSSSGAVTGALAERFADLGERWPGYSMEFKGDHQETRESLAGLLTALTLAMVTIYLILGALFRSYLQPLVIMFSIPFAGTGMVLGHLVMGRGLSMMSLIGLLALTGVVVNDSLILVDLINAKRRELGDVAAAVRVAGRQRFRPIVLTSITTMLGLSPLAFFAEGQARFLQPMAITLFFGLAVATFLILLLVPCAYLLLDDLLGLPGRVRAALRGRAAAAAPGPGAAG